MMKRVYNSNDTYAWILEKIHTKMKRLFTGFILVKSEGNMHVYENMVASDQ